MNKSHLLLPFLALAITGCDGFNIDNSKERKDHSNEDTGKQSEYSYDATNHWKNDSNERELHIFSEAPLSVEPSCEKKGSITKVCSVCGYQSVTEIQAKGHSFAAKNDATHTNTASTCKVPGKHWEYCSACLTWKEVEDPLSTTHIWNEGVVTKQPTTSTAGTKTFTCTVCNTTKTESVSPTGGADLSQGAFTFNSDIETAQKIHTPDQENFLKFTGDYYNITSTQLNSYNAKGNAENSFPKQVTVTWNHTLASGKTLKNYQFFTGQKADLSDGYMITGTTAKTISFYNAFLGDNYFRVIANYTDNTSESSEIKVFKVDETAPRNLKVGTMSNCRDMGGRTTVAGGKIKQGLIYRTSDPATTGVGDVSEWTKRMGIKSELYVKDGSTSSGPLGSTVKFYNASMDYGATPYSNLSRNAERLRYVFSILGNEDNYPTMYHCRIGTDRTGICGVAINGLLGVPFNEVIQDYAFSNFGKIDGQRYAHKTPDNNGDDIAKYIDEILKMPGKNFQEQVYYSLLTIGIPASTLNKVIDILTDGAKATLPKDITVANGTALSVTGGTKKTATDYKNPDTYYEISGSSQSVSYKYNALSACERSVVVYLGCTDSSSSKKLANGIDLKIDGTSQTIVDKTYQLAGFGSTQQARRTGYMFSILGKYNLTEGEHTITVAGKNSDKFYIGGISIIGGDSQQSGGQDQDSQGPEGPRGTQDPAISNNNYKFDISNATGYNNPSEKMKSDAAWTITSGSLPAGNYKVSVEFKLTSSSHGSQTLMTNSTTAVYSLVVGDVTYQPTDKTSTRTKLGLSSSDFNAIEFVSSVTVPANTTLIKLAYTGDGYSMYVNSVLFSKIA